MKIFPRIFPDPGKPSWEKEPPSIMTYCIAVLIAVLMDCWLGTDLAFVIMFPVAILMAVVVGGLTHG